MHAIKTKVESIFVDDTRTYVEYKDEFVNVCYVIICLFIFLKVEGKEKKKEPKRQN